MLPGFRDGCGRWRRLWNQGLLPPAYSAARERELLLADRMKRRMYWPRSWFFRPAPEFSCLPPRLRPDYCLSSSLNPARSVWTSHGRRSPQGL